MSDEKPESELSFLLDLLLNEKLPSTLKKKIKDRICLVEDQYRSKQATHPNAPSRIAAQYAPQIPVPSSLRDQPESTRRLLAKHGMITADATTIAEAAPELPGSDPPPQQENLGQPTPPQQPPLAPMAPLQNPMIPSTPAAAKALQERAKLIQKSINEKPLRR